jgi:NADH:ubiquinone oxidoreductase subunit 4 (subunit M)
MGLNIAGNKFSLEYADLEKREFSICLGFVVLIVMLGMFPNGILYSFEKIIYFVLWGKFFV